MSEQAQRLFSIIMLESIKGKKISKNRTRRKVYICSVYFEMTNIAAKLFSDRDNSKARNAIKYVRKRENRKYILVYNLISFPR